ncbi:MAG: KH domain-containing protein [Candidatus Dormibacteria bacterium]
MPDYRELVSHIVRQLVSRPDDVRVEIEGQGHHYMVRIWTAPEDLGRVIGRQGRNVEAIRMVVRSASLRARDRVQVEVVD